MEVGRTLYAATDEVNLREKPATSANSMATLPMGAAVTVREAGEVGKVNDRVDAWYRVEGNGADGRKLTGWAFGGALTPLRFAADLDGDGEEEIATVSIGWDFKVRVLEPAVKGDGRVATYDLEPAGRSVLGTAGGSASARLVLAREAGLALLQIDSRPEACADFWTVYLSYAAPGGKAGMPGKLRAALSLSGLVDPPVATTYEVVFQPGAHKAIAKYTQDEAVGEEGPKAPPLAIEEVTYSLENGQFAKEGQDQAHRANKARAEVTSRAWLEYLCAPGRTCDHLIALPWASSGPEEVANAGPAAFGSTRPVSDPRNPFRREEGRPKRSQGAQDRAPRHLAWRGRPCCWPPRAPSWCRRRPRNPSVVPRG